MEGDQRGVPNYELQGSFTNNPQAIHEMGFVQFEGNQVLSFLAPSAQSQSSQLSQSLNAGSSSSNNAATKAATAINTTASTTAAATTLGFSHNDLVTRTSWNNEQVICFYIVYICKTKMDFLPTKSYIGFISYFLFLFLISRIITTRII